MNEQLDRIENGIRFLVKQVGFPIRNAWDGIHGEELKLAIEGEAKRIDEAVERIMQTGNPYLPPWDSPANRSYEPVERRAAEIYAVLPYDSPDPKPAWFPNGNSIMQDKARDQARAELRAAGHGS